MSHLKKSIAIITALVGSGFIAPMSSAQNVTNIANNKGAFIKPYAKVQGWEIVRITKDAARKKFDHCAAWKITGSETGLRLAITANGKSFGFSDKGVGSIGKTAPLSVWFNNDKASAASLESRLVTDHNGLRWMMISENNDEPGLFDDAIANYDKISFAHTTKGKKQVKSFSLKGSNTVVARLIACRDEG